MGPPTEQLIRDYLNRLSVAARDRLGPDDRRALVDRTRKLIERKADFAGRPTTLEVGRVLARLGDPANLVEQELRRLAAIRRDLPDGTPQPAGPAESREWADPAEPGSSSAGFLARVLRREPGRAWRRNSGWPTAVASENGVSNGSDAAPGTARLRPKWPYVTAPAGRTASGTRPDPPPRNGTLAGAGMTAADAAGAGPADGGTVNGHGSDGTGTNGTGTGGTGTGSTAASDAGTGDEPENPDGGGLLSGAVGLLRRLANAAWQQPLEATAIILLGVGGVIFPPVFVLGALVALGSRLWHYRDKWAGLVLPPLLTIIGVAAGVAIGGRGHGLHDAWVSLNVVSRIAALLGAGYLAWRTGPGRRPPPAPPWHKPHRVT